MRPESEANRGGRAAVFLRARFLLGVGRMEEGARSPARITPMRRAIRKGPHVMPRNEIQGLGFLLGLLLAFYLLVPFLERTLR